ncbi:hypothetical protein [Gordonia hirsuta]|nr:hypothetical protein [Gordonia hirsuta]
MGEQVENLLDLGERAARFDALRTAIRTTPEELMDSYRDESAEWDRVDR